MSVNDTPKPHELVVMSWAGRWGKGLRQAVSDPFTELTGIPVRHETNIGLKLPPRLIEALERGHRPPFDVVWSNAIATMRVAEAGYCDPLLEAEVANLAELSPRARPEGFSAWPMVAAYVVYYVLAYREEAFPGGEPTTWEVMMDPRYRGRIALYPGGHGFYPIAQVLGGGSVADIPHDMAPCWEYFRRLRPQIGELDYSIKMDEPLRRGELDICFRALPNAIEFRELGLKVGWSAPREGVPDTTDVLWVPKNLPPEVAVWSKRYIDFALSGQVQEDWCGRMGVMPVHQGATPPPELRDDPAFPRSPQDTSGILYVPEIVKMKHELVWEEKFNQIFC